MDLATGALRHEPLPRPRADAIQHAIAALAGPSARTHAAAARALAAVCDDPIAQAALLANLANHPRVRTRAAVAGVIGRCGAAALVPLISAMERDASGLVRSEAALALGRLGESRARPALARAAKSEDANLAWAAKAALKKLP